MKFITITIILLLNYIYTDNVSFNCTSQIMPNSTSDCTTQTTDSGNLCCYLTGVQNYASDKLCISYPNSSYTGATNYNYNGKVYQLDCGKNIAQPKLLPCGAVGAASVDVCKVNSTLTNSCCFEKYTGGCRLLGSKYSGDITWADFDLTCYGNFITLSVSLLFITLAFLF